MDDPHNVYEAAYRAHCGISMSPERRARSCVEDVAAHIEATRAWLAEQGAGETLAATLLAEHTEGYLRRYRAWLGALGRTMSPMVAGPSKFPTRRNQKRMDTEGKRRDEWLTFVRRDRARMAREIKEANRPHDPAESVRCEIEAHQKVLDTMKAANKVLRRKSLSPDDMAAALMEATGCGEKTARTIMQPDDCGRVGFPSYELTSRRGKIKRLQATLATYESAEGGTVAEGDGWTIEEDVRADRLRILFDEIPSEDVRERLKRSGFRWSRRNEAWQRQLTENARIAARRVLEIERD